LKIRTLDSNNSWLFGKGNNDFLTEIEALKENILTRLKSWRTDCFYALEDGVDYNSFLSVGAKNYLDLDVMRVILQSEDVTKILSINSSVSAIDRSYTATINIQTIYGRTEINI
jgi:hypothetical protein